MTGPPSRAPDPALQRALAAEASRAPTVHNVQPARWRFLADGRVMLFRALDRALPVADPTGHDVRLSLGAAWEGMSIALSRHGLALSPPVPVEPVDDVPPGLEPVAEGRIAEGARDDPLARQVEARRSSRGKLLPAPPDVLRRLKSLASGKDARVVADAARIAEMARTYNEAAWAFVGQSAYHAELYRWMRLSRRHAGWDRDGLNADAMALTETERVAASLLLRPRVFEFMKRFGVSRAIVSEAPQIRTASALLLFAPPRALDDFSVGRRFYRLWLEATAAGADLAPMSALADHDGTRAALEREHGIPPTHRLANVFRAGLAPPEGAARSPRLPVGEVLV